MSDAMPTIVLLGGAVTMDDGTRTDSRQAVVGDDGSHILNKSLATSWLWWDVAASLVIQALAGAKEGAFALVIGPRSVVDLRPDGSLKQTRLSGLLRGGAAPLKLDRSGFAEELSGELWRFLDGTEYFMRNVRGPVLPEIVVDTSPQAFSPHPAIFPEFERRRLLNAGSILVLPHTHQADTFVRSYANWLESGRPHREWQRGEDEIPEAQDMARYARPVPIEANFGVTGLLQEGHWVDPSDLEAARSLLHSRFDLKLGLWDLAKNPVLRTTLLESLPTPPAPDGASEVPAAAAERARAVVRAKDRKRERQEAALEVAARGLHGLTAFGWDDHSLGAFRFDLTEPLERWPGREPESLVSLALYVARHSTHVIVIMPMYGEVDVLAYFADRREHLEAIAGPLIEDENPSRRELWRTQAGWEGDADWAEVVRQVGTFTPRWVDAFASLADECRRVRAARFRGRAT